MPRQLYKLNDFSGGLNTVKDVADINDNEVDNVENIMCKVYGSIQASSTMYNATTNTISASKDA